MGLKKITLSAMSVVLVAGLAACSGNNINQASNKIEKMQPGAIINQAKNEVFVADLGNGKKGATLSFELKLNESAFNTKASANGVSQGTYARIKAIKIGITTTPATPATGLLAGTGTELTTASLLPSSSTAKIYTFTNVPVGSGYNIAVQFNGGTASPFNDNLLNLTTHTTNWALSSLGDAKDVIEDVATGQLRVVDAGSTTVNLSDIPVAVSLRNEVLATVGSTVTVTQGTAVGAGITVTSP